MVLSREQCWVWCAKPWVWVSWQRRQQEGLLKTQQRGRNTSNTYSTGPLFATCRHPTSLDFVGATLPLGAPSSPAPEQQELPSPIYGFRLPITPEHRHLRLPPTPGTTAGTEESRKAHGQHLGEITPSDEQRLGL